MTGDWVEYTIFEDWTSSFDIQINEQTGAYRHKSRGVDEPWGTGLPPLQENECLEPKIVGPTEILSKELRRNIPPRPLVFDTDCPKIAARIVRSLKSQGYVIVREDEVRKP